MTKGRKVQIDSHWIKTQTPHQFIYPLWKTALDITDICGIKYSTRTTVHFFLCLAANQFQWLRQKKIKIDIAIAANGYNSFIVLWVCAIPTVRKLYRWLFQILNRKGLGRTGFLEHTSVCGFVFHVSQRIRPNTLGKAKGIPRMAKTPLQNEPQHLLCTTKIRKLMQIPVSHKLAERER